MGNEQSNTRNTFCYSADRGKSEATSFSRIHDKADRSAEIGGRRRADRMTALSAKPHPPREAPIEPSAAELILRRKRGIDCAESSPPLCSIVIIIN